MTTREEALRLADALVKGTAQFDSIWTLAKRAAALLRQWPDAAPQEPVAYALVFEGDSRLCLSTVFDTREDAQRYAYSCKTKTEIVPLYAAPPAAQPAAPAVEPLTDEQISAMWRDHRVPAFGMHGVNPIVFARIIEEHHGIGITQEKQA